MTEENTTIWTTGEERCHMGRKMPKPCPFPATVATPGRYPEDTPTLCAFHAAIMPLNEEADELNISLDLTRTYLIGVRRQPVPLELEGILERAEADFSARLELIRKTMKDLKTMEYALIR